MLPVIPILGVIAAGIFLDSILSDDSSNNQQQIQQNQGLRQYHRNNRSVPYVDLPVFYANDSINSWSRRNAGWCAAHAISRVRCAAHMAQQGKRWLYLPQ